MNRITKLIACLVNPLYRRALYAGHVAAGVEHEVVLRSLGDYRTVVDIGANRGQFALVARHCLPQAHIISFEPLPGPSKTFRRIFADDPQVTLHQAAIGPERGEATIHLSARDDSSSLLPITSTQALLFPGTYEAGTTIIEIRPLMDYVSKEIIGMPALLKLDVQGFELQALHGCRDLLDRFTHIYAECSFIELYAGQSLADEVIIWLRDHGFRLHGVYNMIYDRQGRAIQADFLFGQS